MTETLYQGSEKVVQSTGFDEVLNAVITTTTLINFDRGNIILFSEYGTDNQPVSAVVRGAWEQSGEPPLVPIGTRYDLRRFPVVTLMQDAQPVFFPDINADHRIDEHTRSILSQLGRCWALFPMFAGERWIGWLGMLSDKPVELSERQMRQVDSLVGQAAAVIQSINLLQQTSVRAQQERLLREVTERLRRSTDPDVVMQTAAKELGKILRRNVLIRMGGGHDAVQS